jgi:hypothetical protein
MKDLTITSYFGFFINFNSVYIVSCKKINKIIQDKLVGKKTQEQVQLGQAPLQNLKVLC